MKSVEGRANHVFQALIDSSAMADPREIMNGSIELPKTRGLYAWFFDNIPTALANNEERIQRNAMTLLYIGISPRNAKSKGNLRKRLLKNHLGGRAKTSTLRFSLGCLLQQELRLSLRPKGKSSFW